MESFSSPGWPRNPPGPRKPPPLDSFGDPYALAPVR